MLEKHGESSHFKHTHIYIYMSIYLESRDGCALTDLFVIIEVFLMPYVSFINILPFVS